MAINTNMTTQYRQNAEVRKHVPMCAALSHLLSYATEKDWLQIMEICPTDPRVQALLQ